MNYVKDSVKKFPHKKGLPSLQKFINHIKNYKMKDLNFNDEAN